MVGPFELGDAYRLVHMRDYIFPGVKIAISVWRHPFPEQGWEFYEGKRVLVLFKVWVVVLVGVLMVLGVWLGV